MAPDMPYPEHAYSAHLVQNNLGRMPAIVGSYHRGIQKAFDWLDTRLSWELKLTAAALVSFLVALLFFLLAQLLRYFGIVAYDCARLLPRGFSSNQTVILIVALVIVPGLLLRSPLVSILLLLATLSLVQRVNERLVTVAIFAVLFFLPTLDQRMSDQVQWPGSTTQKLVHAQYIHCDAPCVAGLEAQWLDSGDADPIVSYTLALTQYRQGSPERLANVIEVLEGREQWPEAMQASVENLHGATLVAQAKPDEAIVHLEKAKKLDPTSPAAPYNLMRAYQMQNEGAPAEAALDEAISVNLQAVRTHLEMERRDVNSFLLVEPLNSEMFWQRHRDQASEHVSVIAPVWSALSGPKVPLDRAPLIGIIGALIVLLSLPLYLFARASSPCPKCGLARDPTDAPQTGNHRYCLPCYHTFVSGASLDYNARVHNEHVLGRRERFQDIMRRVLSVIMPGTGHSQAGHGLGGFTITLLTVFGAIILFRPMGLWRPPFELFTDNWGAQKTIAWLLVSVGIFFALAAAARGISPTETTKRTRKRGGDDE
jgi:tetratricopeptide (TPR) repeat protein